jgi:glyoxylase-like metal-dependent hydrolase (beta-lactamase superfamily II)
VRPVNLAYNTVYVVDGGTERILVDTGPDFRGARETLESAVAGRLPDMVVATHGHLDHAGLGRYWQSRGVPVALGREDWRLAAAPQFDDPAEFRAFVGFVEGAGAPPEVVGEVLAGIEARREWARRAAVALEYPQAGRGSRWPTGLRFEPFTPDLAIANGARIGEGGLRALSCPGHTPGNVVLADESEGWLFSGDQLLPGITPTPAIQAAPAGSAHWRYRSLPAFVSSLRRLRGLHVRRCFPGHGEPFDGAIDVIDSNLAAIEQRTDRVLAELRSEGPATLYGVCERIYPRAVRLRFWQIAATIQGHLDLLEERGAIRTSDGLFEAVQ